LLCIFLYVVLGSNKSSLSSGSRETGY